MKYAGGLNIALPRTGKWSTKSIVVATLAVSATLFLLWFAFARTTALGYERIASPDGKVDALVVMRDGRALRGNIYDVYIVRAGGSRSESGERLFSAYRVEGVDVYWQENKQLQIDYRKAYVARVKPHKDCRGIVADSSELPYEVEVSYRTARIF